MLVTHGHLLGGRLHYAQPQHGYRTGIEPVLLAACVPARAGQRVLEAGIGAGAGLLCLLARIPGLEAVGIEIDPAMADLARSNLAANGLAAEIVTGDVTGATPDRFDHAFANPPWHDARSTASPLPARQLAKHATAGTLGAWLRALAAALVADGTLSVIIPAALVPVAAKAMQDAGLGRVARLPLLPRVDRPAKLAIVQARRGEGAVRVPDYVLHEQDGAFTQAAEQVLRGGAALRVG